MSWTKGSFRSIHRGYWRRLRSQKIQRNELLVSLFLESGPGGTGQYTGLYYCAVADICSFTGLNTKEVWKEIESLERRGDILYDREYGLVFVRGMLQRQSTNYNSTENNLNGVANHVARMPEESIARREFIEAQRNDAELFDLLEPYLEVDPEVKLEVDIGERRKVERSKGERGKAETIIPPNDGAMMQGVRPPYPPDNGNSTGTPTPPVGKDSPDSLSVMLKGMSA